jgi:hypothetical protein
MAGAVAGVLSGLPFIGSCLCCLWIVGGAAAAVKLLAKETPTALTSGDGAIVGTLTGIVAAVVQALVSIPLRSFNLGLAQKIMDTASEMGEMPAGLDGLLQSTAGPLSPGGFLLGLFMTSALFAVFGALGGIVGVSIFVKRTARAVPPPPPPPVIPPATPPGPTDAA